MSLICQFHSALRCQGRDKRGRLLEISNDHPTEKVMASHAHMSFGVNCQGPADCGTARVAIPY